jgi:hypothetical protein
MKTKMISYTLGIIGLACSVSLVRAGVLFSEDFESYQTGTWPTQYWVQDANAFNDPANNQVEAPPGGREGQSLKLFGAMGSCWGSLGYRPFTPVASFKLEFDVYNGAEELSGCHPDRAYVGLRQGTSWINPSRSFIQFMGNGDIWGDVALGQYQTAKWYHVEIGYQRSGNQLALSYWIDGEFKGQAQLTISDTAIEDSFDHLDLTAQEGSVWFDNISITEGCPNDADCDGVNDSEDACPNSPVGNVVSVQGCTLSQLVPCEGPLSGGTWKNHGQYVRAVARAARIQFVEAGLMTEEEKDAAIREAAESSCGRK